MDKELVLKQRARNLVIAKNCLQRRHDALGDSCTGHARRMAARRLYASKAQARSVTHGGETD